MHDTSRDTPINQITAKSGGSEKIERLLSANSIAIVGASSDPTKIGGRPLSYLREWGYRGRVVPVNPSCAEVQGLHCIADIRDAEPVDLAILAMPAAASEDSVSACVEAGTGALVLFTAGYAETGEEGARRQRQLVDIVESRDVAMLGPNCLGLINFHTGMTATFATALDSLTPQTGGLSYFGQSGALGAYWIELAAGASLGLSKWITTGNEAQLGAADALAFLARDPNTSVICGYIEEVRDSSAFAEAAAMAREAGKPVLALKSGQSPLGRKAAAAHTGSQSGEDDWYKGYLDEIGIRRVDSLSHMIDTARVLSATKPVTSRKRLGIVTVSGGAGVLVCDLAGRLDIDVATLTPELSARLAAILPCYARPQNPVDVTGAVLSDRQLMGRTITALSSSGECDAILVFIGSMRGIAENLVDTIRVTASGACPILVVWMAAPTEAVAAIEAIGIPVFADIPPALMAIASAAEKRGAR